MLCSFKLSLQLLVVLALVGCATNAPRPAFIAEKSIPTGKGLVYVYRDSGMFGGAVAYMVRANGADVARLSAGGYFPYYASPGEVEFSAQTEAKTSVTIDVKAGETYYIKGTISVGVFAGHPHLVAVDSDVGAREVSACRLVEGAVAAPGEVADRPRTPSGPFGRAVVEIATTDFVSPSGASAGQNLEVADRRAKIVLERTTVGHKTMSDVELRPGELDLIKALVSAKVAEISAALSESGGLPLLSCEINEFSITTPATMTHWDVTTDIAVTLHAGTLQRALSAHTSKRTYVWPSEELLKQTTVEALKSIAAQTGPALRELLRTPPPP